MRVGSTQLSNYDLSYSQIEAMATLRRVDVLLGDDYFEILWLVCVLDYSLADLRRYFNLKKNQVGQLFRKVLKKLAKII